ncbi:MAG: hypothetical protein HY207_13555 [Nitrospirae bacterium]|nr:hypothetical protein [Nitrospirota bacterium]
MAGRALVRLMRSRLSTSSTILCLSLTAVLGLQSCAEAGTNGPLRFGGWVTYWDFAQGLARVNEEPSPLRDIYVFAMQLDPQGQPVFAHPMLADSEALRRIKSDTARWMTVVNDVKTAEGTILLKDPRVVHQILSDPERRREHRRQLLSLAMKGGFSGIDLDYENLWIADRPALTTFMRELAGDLHHKAMSLSATVQPKARESKSDGPGSVDWAALCQSVDRLQIMLYNLHNERTGPGPIATPRWIGDIMRFAETQCTPNRVVAVLKVSGMDWGPGGAHGLQYDRAMALATQYQAAIRRDPDGDVPYFTYVAEGESHTVYFEDATSLSRKISALRSQGYTSILFWSLGREDPALLRSLGDERTPAP